MSRTRYPLPVVPQPENVRYVCVPVPDEQYHIAAFLGALFNLSKWYSWRADDDHTGKLAADMWLPIYRSVAAALEENDGCGAGGIMLLRQNPDDSCQLEFSNDAGETWSLAFDYGLCTPGWAAPIVASNNGNMPPSPYEPGGTWIYEPGETEAEVEQRQLALCEAARIIVNAALDFFVQAKLEQLTVQAAAAIALGILTIINPLIGAGLWAAFGTGVAFAALSIITLHEANITVEEANDPVLRDYFICHLVIALRGRPVTLADFQAAFSDADVCTEEPYTSVAHYLYDLFSTSQYSETMYNNFLRSLGDTTLAVKGGAEPGDCGCPEESWCHRIEGQELFQLITSDFVDITGADYAKGIWDAGNEYWLSQSKTPSSRSSFLLWMRLYVPDDTTITGILFSWGTFGNPNQDTVIKGGGYKTAWTNWAGMGTPTASFGGTSVTSSPSGYGNGSLSISGSPLMFYYYVNANSARNDLYLEGITIYGTGKRMFGSCDNC